MRKILSLTSFLFWATMVFGQESMHLKIYKGDGNDKIYGITQTLDSGFVMVGNTYSMGAGKEDMYILKTNSAGDSLWAKAIGGIGNDYAASIAELPDGNLIVGGYTESYGSGAKDIYIVKLNSKGDTLWTRTVGGGKSDAGISLIINKDGDIVVSGYSSSFSNGETDVYVVSMNLNGDTLWTRNFGGLKSEFGFSMIQLQDGGYLITGSTATETKGATDIYLLKIDNLGNLVWTRNYGSLLSEWANDVLESADGYIYLCGTFKLLANADNQAFIMKLTQTGDSLTTSFFGGDKQEEFNSMTELTNGDIILVGQTMSSGAGSKDIYVAGISQAGDSLFSETYGGYSIDEAFAAIPTYNGGLVIAGYSSSYGNGTADAILIMTDKKGKPISNLGNYVVEAPMHIALFPNPVQNELAISFSDSRTIEFYTVCVFDLYGRTVVNEIYNQTGRIFNLSTAHLLDGVYFLQLKHKNSILSTRKFIKISP